MVWKKVAMMAQMKVVTMVAKMAAQLVEKMVV